LIFSGLNISGAVSMNLRLKAREGGILAGFAFAVVISTGSGAFAQNCNTTQTGPNTVTNIGQLAVPPGGASASIANAITSANSIFLTQQGSAFVSAPSNPAPYQPGGGVWAKAVGGEANVTTTSNSVGVTTGVRSQQHCDDGVRQLRA
jgi:hypothetical protein